MRTFLRRLGNKTNHLKHIIPLIPEFTGTYLEPFLGTGAVYLELLPKKAILNDLNSDIISIWKLIKKDPEYIIKEIDLFKTTFLPLSNGDKLKTCKKILNEMDNFDKKKRTVMYLLMTYCSFNGSIILSNKFYIGGLYGPLYNETSIHIFTEKYKEKIRYLSQILKKVKIYSKDYKLVLKEAKQGDFVFLDPPYLEEKKNSYTYNKNETFDISELKNELVSLDTRNVKWMMTQIDTEETRKLFSKYNIIEYTNKNSFNNGDNITLKNELIIKNYQFSEIGRNLDRKELKKVNAVYKESSNSSGNSSDNSLEETDKMKRLVKSWMKITNITDIAKVFRKIYNSPDSKLLSSEVKSIANNMGLAQSYVSTLYSKGPASKWYRVFSLENDMICIKTEAIEYANSL